MKYSLIALLLIFLFSAMSIYSISFVLYPMAKETNVPISSIEFAIPLSWIGGAIGGVIMGIVGDYWGRRYALLLSILLFSIPMIVNIIAPNLYLLYLVWFLIGFGVNGDNGLSYVYTVELSSPKSRGLIGSIMQGLYDIGALLGALLSAVHDVKLYFTIISILALTSIGLWFLIPESRIKTPFRPSKVFRG